MEKATVKAVIVGDLLTIEVERGNDTTMGVDIRMPAEVDTIDAACKVLMTNLAGISESDLFIAASTALIDADAN